MFEVADADFGGGVHWGPSQSRVRRVKKSCDGNSTTDIATAAVYARPTCTLGLYIPVSLPVLKPIGRTSPPPETCMELSAFQNRGASEAPDGSTPNVNWIEGHVLNPFVNAIAVHPYNAAANVVNFVGRSELLDKKEDLPIAETTMLSPGWFVQNVSSGLGMVVPYALAGKAAGHGMRNAAAKYELTGTAATLAKSEVAAQMTGAALLDFSRDTRPGETRLGNAAGGALAFYVFGKGNALTLTDSFMKRQVARAGVGAVGGAAQLTGSRLVAGEGLPGLEETLEAGIAGGVLNVAMTPTQRGLSKGVELSGKAVERASRWKPLQPVTSAYYGAKWKMQDAKLDAKQATYGLLNKLDIRHPIQRFGNFLNGTDFSDRAIRPKLTAENNPVSAFEKELPEFFRRVKEKEKLMAEAPDRETKWKIDETLSEVRSDFALKLLHIWHGTKENPGMKSYSDHELAISGIGADRVAQIRDALTETARKNYKDPMADKLLRLVPEELRPDGKERNYSLVNEIGSAKEKFWGYEQSAIESMMSLPGFQHTAVRHYETPIGWMPHHATDLLPNLFHGTMSDSFPSMFTEKVMLPAKELKLRGIKQATGESAHEEFPRRAISITRSFGEAFGYHRHSPEYLTGYPAVFGVSADVIPHSWSAGMAEPGEILTGRLRLGSSVLTKLGIQGKAITHLYVPDGQVPDATRQLSSHRIEGVQVVGFSQLTPPVWNTDHKYYDAYVRNYGPDKRSGSKSPED